MVTVGCIAGLLIGGVLIASLDLGAKAHVLCVLGWSSLWLSTLAYISVRGECLEARGLKTSSMTHLGIGLLVGVVGMPVASGVAGAVRELLGRAPENPQLAYILIEGAPIWMTALIGLLVVIVQPLAEEILFRGTLFSSIQEVWGSRVAIVGSAVLFGAMHGELSVVAGTMALGMAFGLLRARTGSIMPAYIAHVANNGIAFLIIHLG